jgi:hypothetical protein
MKEMVTRHSLTPRMLQNGIRRSPGWCEARYLRTLDWLAQHELARREYVLLWVFAVVDNQPGFAIDVAMAYERLFGADDVSKILVQTPIATIRQRFMQTIATQALPRRIKQAVLARLRRLRKRLF